MDTWSLASWKAEDWTNWSIWWPKFAFWLSPTICFVFKISDTTNLIKSGMSLFFKMFRAWCFSLSSTKDLSFVCFGITSNYTISGTTLFHWWKICNPAVSLSVTLKIRALYLVTKRQTLDSNSWEGNPSEDIVKKVAFCPTIGISVDKFVQCPNFSNTIIVTLSCVI